MLARDPAASPIPTLASFEDSLLPMLIADDERRYIDANRAVCLLLRLGREAVLQLKVDDLTPPESRAEMAVVWDSFLRDGVQSGTFELLMPDGPRLYVDYSATANVEPGRHLTIFMPTTESDSRAEQPATRQLSDREREVLALVAMGQSGAMIAQALAVSRTTVETHVRHCLAKLDAKNRAHAIALGLQRREIALNHGSSES